MSDTPPSTREQLREIIDALPDEALPNTGDVIAVQWPIGAYTTEESSITYFNSLRGRFCGTGLQLDATGVATTDANGEAVIHLNEATCAFRTPAGGGVTFYTATDPINVLATTRGRVVAMLSTQSQIVSGGSDVEIRVFAWDPQGQPRPRTTFHWRCTVALSANES